MPRQPKNVNALQHFEAFCSLNGPRFYGLPVNESYVELVREETIARQYFA